MTFCTNCGRKLDDGAIKCDACGSTVTAHKPTPVETVPPGAHSSDDLKTQVGKPSPADKFSTTSGDAKSTAPVGAQVGRVLGGRYQLDQCIGSGGMGEIYRAKRLHIGDTVAVKVLRPDVVDNDKSRQRFYREARAAAMLHHPNAVVIHDFGEDDDGTAYIVMELLVGKSLRQVLVERGHITIGRAYGIVRQTCAALDAGHRNGIVHRDIKPDNIFLLDSNDGADHIKILDFGIAKLADKDLDTLSLEQRLTNIGTVIGTPHYMAPEQCQGEEADSRSDIYSLGVVIYELLTGVAPFIAKTPTGIAIKHVTEQPRSLRELNPNITPGVDKVVLHALEKDPNARPQTALELAREYEAAISDEPDTVRLIKTGEQRLNIAGEDEAQKTEILPGAQKTGETSRTPLTHQGFETIVTPSAGTDKISQPATEMLGANRTAENAPLAGAGIVSEEKGTDKLPPTSQSKTELIDSAQQSKTEKLTDSATEVLGQKQTSPVAPAGTAQTTGPKKSEKAGKDKDKNKDKDKKLPVSAPSTPVQAKAPAVSAVAPATAGSAPKSKMPLIAGVGAVLVVIAAAAWWMMSKGGSATTDQQAVSQATPVQQTETSQQPAPAPTSAYPEVAAPEGMAYVLGGALRIGRDDGEDNEKPAHVSTIKPFFIDKTEVTNGQYQKFIEASGYTAPPSWKDNKFPDGTENLPVTDVSWEDATAYAKWAGKRLPTEEEWEFAARGPEGRIYPWGESWIDGAANIKFNDEAKGQLTPVGEHPLGASPFGILDLSGNAWEWTSSDYVAYPGGSIEAPAKGYKNLKVIRGGSYESTAKYATATLRRGWPAGRKDWPKANLANYIQSGFRCATDAR